MSVGCRGHGRRATDETRRALGRPGAGCKRLAAADPALQPALLALVEPDERGDPMSPLRWTVKSTRRLADELTAQGQSASNAKTLEGKQSPDRDAQFHYLNEQVREHQNTGQPVISVDTKKRELVGEFTNSGREWTPTGEPVKVSVHDFAGPALGKAVPTGPQPFQPLGGAFVAGEPGVLDIRAMNMNTIHRGLFRAS